MTDLVGGFACALVLLTFCMRDMAALRIAALVSNVAFIGYAYLADLAPVMILHAILLPINFAALVGILRKSGVRPDPAAGLSSIPARLRVVRVPGRLRSPRPDVPLPSGTMPPASAGHPVPCEIRRD